MTVYFSCASLGILMKSETQTAIILSFAAAIIMQTASNAATAIINEKDARTWTGLLMTPLTEHQIILGKAAGIVWRQWPLLVLFAAHLLVFTLLGAIHPILLLLLPLMFLVNLAFIAFLGIYFSTICRRAGTAQALLTAVILSPVFFPCCLPTAEFLSLHPAVEAVALVSCTTGRSAAQTPMQNLEFNFAPRDFTLLGLIGIITLTTLLLAIVAALFYGMAASNLRHQYWTPPPPRPENNKGVSKA